MSATAHATHSTLRLDLAALRRMNFNQLEELYRAASKPAAISDLNGDAIGAMLAWRTPSFGPLPGLLRRFGASGAFPWEGKSFKGDADSGSGINRVKLFTRMRWFPFKTRFDKSFLDGQPTFVLDYSGPESLPLIRSIVDEVREVAPKLYMGPAALLVKGRPRPILFFAVSLQERNS
jgi:hypothetical protein